MIDINYIKITQFDTANGPGIRTVLWVAGCDHFCEGCHNSSTWNYNQGNKFTQETIDKILESLKSKYVSGITLSGGDPLYYKNREDVKELILQVREKYPDKTIWLYTGYEYERLLSLTVRDLKDTIITILSNIDVLVDGRFELSKRDITLPYCGSTNQRVIDMKKTLEMEEIILYEKYL